MCGSHLPAGRTDQRTPKPPGSVSKRISQGSWVRLSSRSVSRSRLAAWACPSRASGSASHAGQPACCNSSRTRSCSGACRGRPSRPARRRRRRGPPTTAAGRRPRRRNPPWPLRRSRPGRAMVRRYPRRAPSARTRRPVHPGLAGHGPWQRQCVSARAVRPADLRGRRSRAGPVGSRRRRSSAARRPERQSPRAIAPGGGSSGRRLRAAPTRPARGRLRARSTGSGDRSCWTWSYSLKGPEKGKVSPTHRGSVRGGARKIP